VDKNQSITVALNFKQQMKGNSHYVGAKDVQFVAGKSNLITADDKLTLQTGKTAIVLNKNGDITLVGRVIELKSSQHVVLRGARC
jgi:mannose-6-phosphate isomerase class I